MNVLHTDFHRGWGGQASRVLMVCRQLESLGHHMVVAAPPGELSRRAREAGLAVEDRFRFRPPAKILTFAGDVRRLIRLIRQEKIDILHTHGSQDTWAGAAAAALMTAPPLFLATRHNTKRVRFNAGNRWLYGRAVDHLILVSESVREQFRPFLKAGLLGDDRISVIHSAYRTELFREGVSGEPLRRDLGLEERGPILGVFARLVADKGHTHLFQAMGRVLARWPKAVLLVAGLGPLEEPLRAEVSRRGLVEAVRFLGFRDDVAELTALLDLAVLPSVGCDASSASIKEAMAMGRPIVASDIGGAREIIEDGVTGIVVPPADPAALAEAILSVLSDGDRAREMGERGRSRVRSLFGPEVLGRRTLAVYEKALSGAGRAARSVAAPAAGQEGGRA